MAPAADGSSNLLLSPPQRNVTFAVNYEVANVDRYWQKSVPPRLAKKPNSAVGSVPEPTGVNPVDSNPNPTTRSSALNCENNPNLPLDPSLATPETTKATLSTLSDEDSSGSCKENQKKIVSIKSPTQRRSTREMKKRQTPVERARVRYDMELVPAVQRNRAFLDRFPLWPTPSRTQEEKVKAFLFQQHSILKEQQQKQVQSARNKQPILVDQKQNSRVLQVSKQKEQNQLVSEKDTVSDTENLVTMASQDEDSSPELVADDESLSPFTEDTSVVWVPKSRSEWEDCVQEMTAVCTSAAMRRQAATRGRIASTKSFHPPLSKEYIRDRVDIDDPLNGFQLRHKTGGWLQGFILWTNFTTWTHYFKWDSSHAMSGIPTMNSGNKALVDADGSLASELEGQPRSGNPFEGGVVFEAVAEISLVGGLGCGEYLLRMALDSIRSKRKYKFVVLQATDSSKTFYERFGFVRVGAICRYERKDKDPSKPGARPDTPIMGYRHWTHANESDSSLQKHGGPSYMMCLKLPEIDENDLVETPFLDEMMKLEVDQKPKIEQLGGGSTPHPKLRRSSIEASPSQQDAQVVRSAPRRKFGKGRRSVSSPESSPAPSLAQTMSAQSPPVLPVLRGSNFANASSSNDACAPTPIQEKIAPRSTGVKRNAETTDVSEDSEKPPNSKKRRLADEKSKEENNASSDEAADTGNQQPEAPAQKDDGKAPPPPPPAPRRTPRILANQQAAAAAAAVKAPESSAAQKNNKKPSGLTDTSSSKKKAPTKTPAKRSTPRRIPAPAPTPSSEVSNAAATAEDKSNDPSRTGPMKQKVKSYPRDRVHFYNKVVRPKRGRKSENYFVLHYDEGKGTIRIIPMEPRGVLSGKRAGRPRFQAVMTNVARDAKTVRCADYDIVKAFMVMKTPVVASEAWDVLDA